MDGSKLRIQRGCFAGEKQSFLYRFSQFLLAIDQAGRDVAVRPAGKGISRPVMRMNRLQLLHNSLSLHPK